MPRKHTSLFNMAIEKQKTIHENCLWIKKRIYFKSELFFNWSTRLDGDEARFDNNRTHLFAPTIFAGKDGVGSSEFEKGKIWERTVHHVILLLWYASFSYFNEHIHDYEIGGAACMILLTI